MARRLEWNIGLFWRAKLEVVGCDLVLVDIFIGFFHDVGIVPYISCVLTVSDLGGLRYRVTEIGANEESVFIC
jgi:hypothetical protein